MNFPLTTLHLSDASYTNNINATSIALTSGNGNSTQIGPASVSLINGSVGVVLSAIPESDRLSLSTAPDTGATKEFSRSYLPINVGGDTYYIPLFVAP